MLETYTGSFHSFEQWIKQDTFSNAQKKKDIFKLYFSFVAFDKPLFVFEAETNESL